MSSSSMTAVSAVAVWLRPMIPYVPAGLYLAVEVAFLVIFYKYMIPRANRLTKPAPYRDYGKDRKKLMLRIMHRIEKTCEITKADETTVMKMFLTEWFHVETKGTAETKREETKSKQYNKNIAKPSFPPPDLTLTPSTSPENSDDEESSSSGTGGAEDIVLFREDMDEFFAWAFFGKFYHVLHQEEIAELEHIYKELEVRHDLTFPYQGKTHDNQQAEAEIDSDEKSMSQCTGHICKARCMSLEPVRAVYRPLLVYLIVSSIKIGAGVILRLFGFHRMVAQAGLVAWYRPASASASASGQESEKRTLLPLLFFHGIAPGGFSLYLPLLLFGFATEKDRPVFLFENRSISCAIDFEPLTEEQTVDGVVEILNRCGMQHADLTLMGHSFGSCSITWLVAAALSSSNRHFTNSIKQIVLIDPVAILLSEPDVMVNFLYSQEVDKIRAVASSELFTETYLRRHFAWYNSELYVEDVAKLDGCQMIVALSEKDEIINATKVKQEMERHGDTADLIYWTNIGHGAAIPSPSKWRQVKQMMLGQELKLAQAKKGR